MPGLLDSLAHRLGPSHVLRGADAAAYETDWRGLFPGRALAVLRPGSTEEVAACVRLAAEHGVCLVPQGGNTGLCGGAAPDASGRQLVLSLARLTRIRALDPLDLTLAAEAGVTLQAARDAAAAQGCTLPLWIASGGTATLGGLASTNAGGIEALRHGTARDLVLGLEVVLPDGTVWNGLRGLRKESAGVALRHLFLGAEGTLGIVTATLWRLAPARAEEATALCAVPTIEAALALLQRLRREAEGRLAACEYLSGAAMALVRDGAPAIAAAPHHVLVELASARAGAGLAALLEATLEDALHQGEVQDATLAQSTAQRAALWRLREDQAEAQRRAGPDLKNDVAVPLSAIPAFLAEAAETSARLAPGSRPVPFGHLGDGNLHYNVLAPVGAGREAWAAPAAALATAIAELAVAHGGTFSAEHGIGRLKTGLLERLRDPEEIALMRRLREALDPAGTLNPAVLLPGAPLPSVKPAAIGRQEAGG